MQTKDGGIVESILPARQIVRKRILAWLMDVTYNIIVGIIICPAIGRVLNHHFGMGSGFGMGLYIALALLLWLIRDGAPGVSWKYHTGLIVVDSGTHAKCTIRQSIMRNSVWLLPWLAMHELSRLRNQGRRLGDTMAGTDVLLRSQS